MGVRTEHIVGRDAELEIVDALLGAARRGQGVAAQLMGEPGSGKSTLLGAARSRAGDLLVLGCLGMEWEAEVPYSGVHQLVGPLLADLSALPDPQREAVERAIGIAPSGPLHALHLRAGVLSLVLEATRERPVLIIADDLQWIDEPTRQLLAFITRRIAGEPVAVLGATRQEVLPRWADAPTHALSPLTPEEVGALAADALGARLPEAAVADLSQAVHGNPLAVVEAVRRFGDRLALRGTGLDAPLAVGDVVRDAFVERLDGLSMEAVETLELLAVSHSDDAGLLYGALAQLGASREGLLECERAELVRMDAGTIAFAHPLLRALVHERTSPDQWRRLHAAFATVERLDDDLRAWHAASAVTERDEAVASVLAASAQRFVERGGHLAAAQALDRAAQLTPDPDARAERWLRAALSAQLAGRSSWAIELADSAAAVATTVVLAAQSGYYRDTFEANVRPNTGLSARYLRHADRLGSMDPALSAEVLARATNEAAISADLTALRAAVSRLRSVDFDGLSPHLREDALTVLGVALIQLGWPDANEGREILLASGRRRLAMSVPREGFVVEALGAIEAFDLAEELARAALARAHADADLLTGVVVSASHATIQYRIGAWDQAAERFDTFRPGESELDNPALAAWTVAMVAPIAGARGERHRLQQALEAADVAAGFGHVDALLFAANSTGLLALADGDYQGAIVALERATSHHFSPERPDPHPLSWPFDVVEAYWRAGRAEDARRAAGELAGMAARSPRAWLGAAVHWADGLLAGDDAFEGPLRVAVEAFAATRAPFDRARVQMLLGERLEQVGRSAEAVVELELALAEFERLEAAPWVERARQLLGRRAPVRRRPRGVDRDALTPQERQVAALVAGGATNKQAAGELYLSPKTIEAHLSRAYRKLGVNSRTQLAARWSELQGDEAP
jgi:DNA-binding CsgD family transcriptional regulator